MIIPVILSGGSGSRLWPASRGSYPKQLLPMISDETMLQQTANRITHIDERVLPPMIVCNDTHRFMVAEQLRSIGVDPRIVLEPQGRNTAPAVALAALLVPSAYADESIEDAVMLVMPADHIIRDTAAFSAAVTRGLEPARSGKLVTFGVVPTHAHTGYGYIHAVTSGDAPVEIAAFVEKPDQQTAERYVESGDYLWNSGMFLLNPRAYLEELRMHAPAMLAACTRSVTEAERDLDFIRPEADAFAACPSDSIDYAVMEKTDKAMVVPLDAGWSDLGSWPSLQEARVRDAQGNAITGDVVAANCRDSLISSESRLVAAVGLDGYVVVETKDAVLVAPKSQAEDVKKLVETMKAAGRPEVHLHRQVYRPWGSYDGVDQGENFQVKRLIVKPGATLSLQLHRHRAEHWVVVKGKARITRGDDVFDLQENESTFIPIGEKHRIANPFDEPAHIIEVQSGHYLGEDDIVRFEDRYGREVSNS
jgi:mannose-1-phosphate guanylyltransferase/mannose-6-phosphate isomerase